MEKLPFFSENVYLPISTLPEVNIVVPISNGICHSVKRLRTRARNTPNFFGFDSIITREQRSDECERDSGC